MGGCGRASEGRGADGGGAASGSLWLARTRWGERTCSLSVAFRWAAYAVMNSCGGLAGEEEKRGG
jgi:hypothetical protein